MANLSVIERLCSLEPCWCAGCEGCGCFGL